MPRKNRPMTNRRMFVTMLLGSMLRRRSRVLVAVLSSAVGAATLFCLAAVCLAVPGQMSAQMRQFGANLIVVPVSADGSAARVDQDAVDAATGAISAATGIAADEVDTASYRYETVRASTPIGSGPSTGTGRSGATGRPRARCSSASTSPMQPP